MGGGSTESGRRNAELAAKGVGEVTVAGEAEIEGQTAEILLSTSQRFEGGPQPQPGEVAMDR
jgi:hypothetical protein